MAAAEYPPCIIDTRGNIGITDTRNATDVFHPRAFSADLKRSCATKKKGQQRPSISPGTLSEIIDTREAIEIIDTRGTIDVFHTAPFGIVEILDALDIRDRTSF